MKSYLPQRLMALAALFSLLLLLPNTVKAQLCDASPLIEIPATYNGCPGDEISPSNTGMAIAMPGSADCPSGTTLSYIDSVHTNTMCEVLIRRTWTAEYSETTKLSLTSMREQIIWLQDTVPPNIVCPADVILDSQNPEHTWTTPTTTDACGIASVTSDYQSGHLFPVGTTTVTITAEDLCGMISTCSFDVTVEQNCSDQFFIICPPHYNGCVSDDTSSVVTGIPTINSSGVLCGDIVLSYFDQIATNDGCQFNFDRIWTASMTGTDYTKKCVQRIRLTDTESPTIGTCPSDITLDFDHGPYTWTEPTASDACTNASLVSIAGGNNGSTFPEGTTTITYTYADNCGNESTCSFNITVLPDPCTDVITINCPADYAGCSGEDITPVNTGMATVTYSDDPCNTAVITYVDNVINPNTCQMVVDRVWTATIANANVSQSCTQRITVTDNEVPEIQSCPADATITLPTDTYTWAVPTATDNCSPPVLGPDINNGSIFAEGTTTVTYTATDACGNTATCAFTVTVVDPCTDAITINCPADYTGCKGEDSSTANTGVATVTYSTDPCNSAVVTYVDNIVTNTSCQLIIDRIWTATIANENIIETCTQRISLTDDDGPIIHNCPSDVTLEISNATYTWTEPTASDNCSSPTLTSSIANGSTFGLGTTTVTYTATDDCGNTTTCAFTVTVFDPCDNDITINCPADYTGCKGEDSSTANTGMTTVTYGTNACSTAVITYQDNFVTNTSCQTIIDRVWTATIASDNIIETCTQRISLTDNDGPIIHSCPSNVTLDFDNATYTWTAPTASDNCSTPTLTSSIANGSTFGVGTTTITYTATDACGNTTTCAFTVTVLDDPCTNDIVINCPSNYVGCRGESPETSNTGTATVTYSADPCNTAVVSYVDNIVTNTSCQLIIDRVWTATIASEGITKSCTQRISLTDNAGPVIHSCPSNVTLDLANATYTWTPPTASDNCSNPTLTSSIVNGSTFGVGTTTVKYTATDVCGNTTTCAFTVTVLDDPCTDDIVINCPSNYVGCRGESSATSNTGTATVTYSADPCNTAVVSYVDNIVTNTSCQLIIDRVWSATIASEGITKTCIQRISLIDNNGPVIHSCPSNVTLNLDNATYTWTVPTTSDNCSNPTLTSSIANGSTFGVGTTTVTYTATDACGNTTTCAFTVTVLDDPCTNEITINCPNNYIGCRGDNSSSTNTGAATVSYSADPCATASITHHDNVITNTSCELIIDRVWTATISGTNISESCTQRITLIDNDGPTIQNCPQDVTLSTDNATYTWTPPTATDGCSTPALTSNIANGSTFSEGTTTVTYTATDACGNTTTCSFDVIVVGGNTGSSLIASCPTDITVACGETLNMTSWPLPEVTTTCGSCTGDLGDNFVYMGELDGHQYFCSRYPATWANAQNTAANMGGYLASITSAEENHLLSNFLEVRAAYIGLSDHTTEGTFAWTSGEPVSYTNWYPNQPNNYNNAQDHVELLQNGYWNDQYHYKALEFIIEIPCVQIQITSGPATPADFNGQNATVEYLITDGCGNSETCSFDIVAAGGMTLTCPDDVIVDLAEGQTSTTGSWAEPTVQTCCTASGSGAEIPGYVYMGTKDGHDYYCSKVDATWANAQAAAVSYGGYLAIIDNAEENSFLANFLTVQSAYIGLSDHQDEGNFTWVNGAPVTYSNWYPNQPNNYNNQQHYVELLSNGQWNDQYEHKKREYIMEIPSGTEIVQTGGPLRGSAITAGTHSITYQATDGCGNVQSCSFTVTVNGSTTSNVNCDISPSDSDNFWIQSTQWGDYNFVSGNDGGYRNHTDQCVSVSRGEVIPILFTPGFSGGANAVYWSIFVDWNDDKAFGTSERIAKGVSKSGLTGNFKFDLTLPVGTFSMRVILNPKGYRANGCDPLPFGEVEDYCLTINNVAGIASKPQVGKKVVSFEEVELVAIDLNPDSETGIDINKNTLDQNFIISPNPFVSKVDISDGSYNKVRVWDLDGKLLKVVSKSDGVNSIDLDDLDSGILLFEIVTSEGDSIIKRVIKR